MIKQFWRYRAKQTCTSLFCLVNPSPMSLEVALNLIAADSENVVYLSTAVSCADIVAG